MEYTTDLRCVLSVPFTEVWKHWANYRTFWPIFTTLVLLPIYFVYSLVSIYQTFTRIIGQCPAWLGVSTPPSIHLHVNLPCSSLWFFFICVGDGNVCSFQWGNLTCNNKGTLAQSNGLWVPRLSLVRQTSLSLLWREEEKEEEEEKE